MDQARSPSKWIYEITAAGQEALTGWLARPARQASTFRSEFLLRFFFAHRMSPAQVQALLAGYRAALTAQRDDYQAMLDKVTHLPGPAARIGRLSVLHGLRTTEARLGWVAEAEAEFC